MTTTSSVPLVCAALAEAIRERVDSETDVHDGRPINSLLSRQFIVVADVRADEDVRTSRNARPYRDERYTVELHVWVAKPDGSTAEATAKAYELRSVIEDVVADDPTCSAVAQVIHWTIEGHDLDRGQGNEGPVAFIRQRVRVLARND